MLALIALGLSASGIAGDTIYRGVSALWLGASVWFTTFSIRATRNANSNSETSLEFDTSGRVLFLLLVAVAAIQATNVAFFGLFWPLFVAFLFSLLAASNAFYRLLFLDAR